MKTLAVFVIILAWSAGSGIFAQDTPAELKPRYTSLEMRKRISGDVPTCRLAANKTTHPVNATVTVAGQAYRCVAVLDENLDPAGAAWTPAPPEPAAER